MLTIAGQTQKRSLHARSDEDERRSDKFTKGLKRRGSPEKDASSHDTKRPKTNGHQDQDSQHSLLIGLRIGSKKQEAQQENDDNINQPLEKTVGKDNPHTTKGVWKGTFSSKFLQTL